MILVHRSESRALPQLALVVLAQELETSVVRPWDETVNGRRRHHLADDAGYVCRHRRLGPREQLRKLLSRQRLVAVPPNGATPLDRSNELVTRELRLLSVRLRPPSAHRIHIGERRRRLCRLGQREAPLP
jgi:hypothetical protein